MAGATWYGNISGAWSSSATWGSADDGLGGDGTPADDDYVVIDDGVSVQMDTDTSGWTTGLRTVTIRGASGTPGMLYFSGSSGYLKIQSGYNLIGTSGTNKGRLLANSNGTWGQTGALGSSYTAVIRLLGTAKIDAQYLDIALYCTQPTSTYARIYNTRYDFTASGSTVDTSANTIDLGTTPPTATTAVMITTASGTLPGGLYENTIYFVRGVSGTKCKLATISDSDTTIVDLTSTGSGTCSLITGYASGASTFNVLDDVTGDSQWKTTDGWDRVAIINYYPVVTLNNQLSVIRALTTINAGSLVVDSSVGFNVAPGARIYLASRNVSILSGGTTFNQPIVDYANATSSGGVFQCEISNVGGSVGQYSYGINYSTGTVVSGVVANCYRGLSSTVSASVSGLLLACNDGINSCQSTTVSGTVAGCQGNGIWPSANFDTAGGTTITALVLGCGDGIEEVGPGSTFNGTIMGCTGSGISTGVYGNISGTIKNCLVGISSGVGHTVSADIFGCNTALSANTGFVFRSTTIHGNNYGIIGGADSIYIGSSIGYTPTGEVHGHGMSDFSFPLKVTCRGTLLPSTLSYSNRNAAGQSFYGGVFCENCSSAGRSLGDSVSYQSFGTITKQTGTVRSGGNTSALQVDPLSLCSTVNPLLIFEWTEPSVAASSQSRTVYIRGFGWSSYPTSSELYVEAEYISNATTYARSTAASTAVLTDNTTWVAFTMSFTPAAAGHVRYRGWIKKYSSSSGVYVDTQLN